MRAKEFSYVCAGILMLVIAYSALNCGDRSPTRTLPIAQPAPSACGAHIFATEDGQLYSFAFDSFPGTFVPAEKIPVRGRLVALGEALSPGGYFAVADDGDVFRYQSPEGWSLDNNVFARASNAPPADGPVVDAVWDGASVYAITAKGNAYDGGPLQWRYLGNIHSAPASATGATRSKVKDAYREKGAK